jgi:hypothetical protein
LAAVKAELPPGLYVLLQAGEAQPLVLGLSGGPALETAVVTLRVDGETIRRREIDVDGAGVMVVSLPMSLLDGPGETRVRVVVPLLGTLDLDPTSDIRVLAPAIAPPPAPIPMPSPSPVPVQLPAA